MTLDLTQVVRTSGGLRNTAKSKIFASRFLVTQVLETVRLASRPTRKLIDIGDSRCSNCPAPRFWDVVARWVDGSVASE